eukprot:scaffold55086_cov64-Phaeocystis_antarctica.AAC.11
MLLRCCPHAAVPTPCGQSWRVQNLAAAARGVGDVEVGLDEPAFGGERALCARPLEGMPNSTELISLTSVERCYTNGRYRATRLRDTIGGRGEGCGALLFLFAWEYPHRRQAEVAPRSAVATAGARSSDARGLRVLSVPRLHPHSWRASCGAPAPDFLRLRQAGGPLRRRGPPQGRM